MQGLRNIRTAIIDDDFLALMCIKSEIRLEIHLIQILFEIFTGNIEVDEARHDRFRLREKVKLIPLHFL